MSASPTFLNQVFIRKASAFAGNSFLIYDYLLTLPLEVTYIWNTPWTLVKALFLVDRYMNLTGQTFIMLEETGYLSHGSQKFCIGFQIFQTCFAVVAGELIRLLVVMRACAILRCRRSIAMLLNASYVLCIVGIVGTVLVESLINILDAPEFEYLDEIGICYAPVPPNSWKLLFVPLSLDAFVFLVVCHSLWQLTRGCRGTYPLRLVQILTRDALLFYFAALFNVLLSIMCSTIFSQDPRTIIQELISCPFISVIGQRLILHLREFQARLDSTSDLSREVNRQIAAMDDLLYSPPAGQAWSMDLDVDHEGGVRNRDALGHDHGMQLEWGLGGAGDGELTELMVLRPRSLLGQ